MSTSASSSDVVEGRVATGDGLQLHYEIAGPPGEVTGAPGAPLLLCAAGGPGRASEYLGDLGGLTATRRVVRVDTRGTGRSQAPDSPDGYAIDRLVDDLERVRAALGEERIDVLGHSAGGPVALAFAAAHPSAVRRLVLATTQLAPGPEAETEKATIRASRSAEPWYAEAVDAAEGMPYARPAELQRLSRLQRAFYYGVWDERTSAHAAAADRQMNPRAEAGISAALKQAAGRAGDLLTVPAPTLVVSGSLDVITPPSGGRQLAESLPDARFVLLDGVGHFPWVDGPEQFASAVDGFLA